MENTQSLHIEKFIFPPTVRKYYNICGLITIFGLLFFAVFMLVVGLNQDSNKIPCYFVAATFGAIHIGYVAIWIRNYHLINATYDIQDNIVTNFIDKKGITTKIDQCCATQNEYTFSLHFGYAKLDLDYLIYSDDVLSDNAKNNITEVNLYKTVRRIWANGYVIVPKQS